MELLAGGTLQDRVTAQGPLPPAEAVDAVLQILAGLEAAQRVGILHRDIKPSNCFSSPDGVVKIGDFGLSISTAVRTEPALTARGAFLARRPFVLRNSCEARNSALARTCIPWGRHCFIC